MKKGGYKILEYLGVFRCASVCFCSSALAMTAQNSTDYKMIPITQWEQLKQTQRLWELKLEELKNQTVNLKKHSTELELRLSEAEQAVTQSKQALMNSNASLEKLKNLLEQTQTSLTKLTEQLDDEREKQRAIQNKLRVQKSDCRHTVFLCR